MPPNSNNDDASPALAAACRHYARITTGIDIAGSKPPSFDDVEIYTAAMLVCCAADGELHPHELEWIIGHQSAFGAPASILDNIDELKERWTRDEVLAKIEGCPKLRLAKGALVFHCLSACDADGNLAEKEVSCIRGVSEALGMSGKHFEQLLGLYKDQAKLNEKILGAIWNEKNPWQ